MFLGKISRVSTDRSVRIKHVSPVVTGASQCTNPRSSRGIVNGKGLAAIKLGGLVSFRSKGDPATDEDLSGRGPTIFKVLWHQED